MLPRGSVADPGIFQEVEDKSTFFGYWCNFATTFWVYWTIFQRLRVLPFDPQCNFTSILMSGFLFNFFLIDRKNIFDRPKKKFSKKSEKWKISKNSKMFNEKSQISKIDFWDLRFFIEHFRVFRNFSFFRFFGEFFFWPIENIFSIDQKKVEQKSGHQYRSKIALRIEWEHSQPLKYGSINSESCSKVTPISKKGGFVLHFLENPRICHWTSREHSPLR